ncbi:transposase [Streptomyces sp. NPDC096311]|uniref:helix-turn-helix domain-containing protein n=1 Tax=Streptomyces sp. NPDC096311 TaxID=3366083 RepID=UPI003830A860
MAAVVGNTAKIRALRESRTLNPRPEAVTDEAFAATSFLDPHDLVQVKYEMVRRVRVDKVPVARAAKAFGFCRQSFYAIAAALDAEGPAGLVPGKPGPKGPSKLTGPVMEHLEALLEADPAMKARVLAEAVAEEFGLTVHPRSVERALARRREGRQQGVDPSLEPGQLVRKAVAQMALPLLRRDQQKRRHDLISASTYLIWRSSSRQGRICWSTGRVSTPLPTGEDRDSVHATQRVDTPLRFAKLSSNS